MPYDRERKAAKSGQKRSCWNSEDIVVCFDGDTRRSDFEKLQKKTSKNDLNILFLPSSRDRPRAFETTYIFHLFVKSAVVCFVKVGGTVERDSSDMEEDYNACVVFKSLHMAHVRKYGVNAFSNTGHLLQLNPSTSESGI